MSTLPAWADLLLALGLTLRLTRLLTGDTLTEPLRYRLWASVKRREEHPRDSPYPAITWPPTSLRGWTFSGLTCPFCVGFWIAAAVCGSLALVGGPGDAAEWWRWTALVFAMNWVAAHLGSRAGDAGHTEDED